MKSTQYCCFCAAYNRITESVTQNDYLTNVKEESELNKCNI